MLTFKVTDTLKSIMDWSEQHPEQSLYGDPLPEPSVIIVKDQGVYLMAPTNPRQTLDDDHCVVAYAEGCDPGKDEDFYERGRDEFGGDDGADAIPVSFLRKATKEITIDLSENEMKVEVE